MKEAVVGLSGKGNKEKNKNKGACLMYKMKKYFKPSRESLCPYIPWEKETLSYNISFSDQITTALKSDL